MRQEAEKELEINFFTSSRRDWYFVGNSEVGPATSRVLA